MTKEDHRWVSAFEIRKFQKCLYGITSDYGIWLDLVTLQHLYIYT